MVFRFVISKSKSSVFLNSTFILAILAIALKSNAYSSPARRSVLQKEITVTQLTKGWNTRKGQQTLSYKINGTKAVRKAYFCKSSCQRVKDGQTTFSDNLKIGEDYLATLEVTGTRTFIRGIKKKPTPKPTATPSPSATSTPTPTATSTPAPTATPNPTASPSPTPTPRYEAQIDLPIEMLKSSGNLSKSVYFLVSPEQANISGNWKLRIRAFGIQNQSAASVSLNDKSAITLTNSTTSQEAMPAKFDGIGGGYSTLWLDVPVPQDSIKVGENVLTFTYNGTDGTSIGYRILNFEVLKGTTNVISQNRISNFDPTNEPLIFSDANSIAEGKTLWETASLAKSSLQPNSTMRARCQDCHARSGYDLKYFGYSNNAIIERAQFHGLNLDQSKKIASYIRSLNAIPYGRPWNPPYQPGPGIDSKPIGAWAAGAGVDAVLKNDSDMFNYLYATSTPADWNMSKETNARQMPLAIELPVWNHWLPRIHPMDSLGSTWDSSKTRSCYERFFTDTRFQSTDWAKQMEAAVTNPEGWGCGGPVSAEHTSPATIIAAIRGTSPTETDWIENYSYWQTIGVRMWEMMHVGKIETLAANMTTQGSTTGLSEAPRFVNPRSWFTGEIFRLAPHMVQVPFTGHGIRTGTRKMWDYFSTAWYQLQLILYDNQRRGDGASHWPYLVAFSSVSGPGNRTFVVSKTLEAYYNNNLPAVGGAQAFNLNMYLGSLADNPATLVMSTVPTSFRRQISESFALNYINRVDKYTFSQFAAYYGSYIGPSSTASIHVHGDTPDTASVWYWTISHYKSIGVNQTIVNRFIDKANTFWPHLSSRFEEFR